MFVFGVFSGLYFPALGLKMEIYSVNGQHSSWTNVQAGVPQGSILGPLFFLIYINDLADGLTSNPKLFADDTSLFSVVQNIIKVSDCAF